ncbi:MULTISPECIES: hypothetical protein [Clostridium]|uniref:Uncharacterized protein n=1 Tax=Clostridium cadaveris TaxID=1529 RepID=A0A1I2KFI1_9CLOT|nr:hypothetical protein [Clostridium cadaveris]MDU4952839.1 hypothetical protein [Clostridium sp.]MDM8313109.1 hypothetical protein [Clostridium cadaveris]MDY4950430.1 hypothetical protein [Clostridium cadaveris]NME65992.1 hypothetical protein [Clostridium cadaveris]NWK11354.1 hypothetical protein [Clostridium cadaveris]
MIWIECIKSIASTGKAGKCPYCGNINTDYAHVKVDNENGYLDVWCNECKKMGHISRVRINKEIKNVINLDEVHKVIPKYEITY